jgi:hypothetical protein
MAAADAQTAARVERMGMSLISPEAGLAALEGVLSASASKPSTSSAVVSVVPFRWQRMMQRLGQAAMNFLAEAAPSKEMYSAALPKAARSMTRTTTATSHQQLARQMLQQVRGTIHSVLGHEVGLLLIDCALSACGVRDSWA